MAKIPQFQLEYVWESHWDSYSQKESVSYIEVANIGKKWLVLVIFQR